MHARIAALDRLDFGQFNKGILAGWGVDVRDPTADRRLVELCLRIPADQFLRDGVPRALARCVLGDRLPPAVLGEMQRGYQAADWFEGLDAARSGAEEEGRRVAASPAASRLIDIRRMSALFDGWPDSWGEPQTNSLYRRALLRGLSAGHFIRKIEGSNL